MDSINVTSSIYPRIMCARAGALAYTTSPNNETPEKLALFKVMTFAKVLAYERSNCNSQNCAWLDEAKPTNAALWLQMNTLSKTAPINSSLLSLLPLSSYGYGFVQVSRELERIVAQVNVSEGYARGLLWPSRLLVFSTHTDILTNYSPAIESRTVPSVWVRRQAQCAALTMGFQVQTILLGAALDALRLNPFSLSSVTISRNEDVGHTKIQLRSAALQKSAKAKQLERALTVPCSAVQQLQTQWQT